MHMILLAPLAILSATAQKPDAAGQSFERLLACRSLNDAAARLACFDKEAASLGATPVVVVERRQVEATQRATFGLSLPEGTVVEAQEKAAPLKQIESRIVSASQAGYNKWALTLEDGSRWVQVESKELLRDPKPGQTVVVRRAALRSYLANIDGQIAVRVRRQQ
jgi:hypothetical protein